MRRESGGQQELLNSEIAQAGDPRGKATHRASWTLCTSYLGLPRSADRISQRLPKTLLCVNHKARCRYTPSALAKPQGSG